MRDKRTPKDVCGEAMFMTVYGQILYVQETLDKRKHCTRELFFVVRTEICQKKTLRAVFRAVIFYFC